MEKIAIYTSIICGAALLAVGNSAMQVATNPTALIFLEVAADHFVNALLVSGLAYLALSRPTIMRRRSRPGRPPCKAGSHL